ncbi:hypothetical protein [Streptomyces natalensis]|uniref:hypothetical protein n=1 Tax=Streptomyces natalensis TaxID=68242 RepID=UPI0006902E60|nr:hypothetical protein [Streptomyces natalensis]
MFTCLLIRRPRRLRHLRRLATSTNPATRTRLPCRPCTPHENVLPPLPAGFPPAPIQTVPDPKAPGADELRIRARLYAVVDSLQGATPPEVEAGHG